MTSLRFLKVSPPLSDANVKRVSWPDCIAVLDRATCAPYSAPVRSRPSSFVPLLLASARVEPISPRASTLYTETCESVSSAASRCKFSSYEVSTRTCCSGAVAPCASTSASVVSCTTWLVISMGKPALTQMRFLRPGYPAIRRDNNSNAATVRWTRASMANFTCSFMKSAMRVNTRRTSGPRPRTPVSPEICRFGKSFSTSSICISTDFWGVKCWTAVFSSSTLSVKSCKRRSELARVYTDTGCPGCSCVPR